MNCVVERANRHLLEEHATEIVERFVKPFPDTPDPSPFRRPGDAPQLDLNL